MTTLYYLLWYSCPGLNSNAYSTTLTVSQALVIGMGIVGIVGMRSLHLQLDVGSCGSDSLLSGANFGDFGQHQLLTPDGYPANMRAMVVFNQVRSLRTNYIMDRNSRLIRVICQCLLALELMSISALTLIKLSVLLFYRRIFSAPAFRIPVWVVGSLVTAWGTAFFFANLFQCTPISGVWELTAQRRCVNSKHLVNAYQGLNLMTDVMILIMPWPMIWGLQLQTRRKAQVGGIFLLGAL